MIALSHSRLNDFKTCPLKFFLKYIEKSYPDDSSNPHFVRGRNIHKQCEEYILAKINRREFDKRGVGFEAQYAAELVDKLYETFPIINAEQQIAINKSFDKTDWFGADVMYRGIFDFTAFNDTFGIMVDWKTGKVSEYDEFGGQLHLAATIMMSINKQIESVNCVYAFLDHKQISSLKVTRKELPQLQGYYLDQFEEVNKTDDFNPCKNKYCKWCAVPKSRCKYSSN